MKITVIFEQIMALHRALRLPAVTEMKDKRWAYKLGPWWLALNGTEKEVRWTPPGSNMMRGIMIPWGVTVWHGFAVVAVLDAFGGQIIGGPDVSEDKLIKALEIEIKRVGNRDAH